MVEVEPELADEADVRPDSSCWWRCSLLSLRRRTTSTRAAASSNTMASVSVAISANIEWALSEPSGEGAKTLWMKSRMAELCAPSNEDMLDEVAGVALVWTR